MSHSERFSPPWWLRNRHLQTIWPTLFRRQRLVQPVFEKLELADGDFLELAWNQAPPPKDWHGPLILILHGLEGSQESPYAQGMLQAFKQRHWPALVMHFRGASGKVNRLPRSYHSGETGDPGYVIEYLHRTYPNARLAAVGYSLGANVLIKYLGEQRQQTPLTSAVAVSPPLQLAACADAISRGLSRFYQGRLIRQMRNSFSRKLVSLSAHLPFSAEQLSRVKDFWQFDDVVTAPLHGFRDVHHYYQACSGMQYLPDITKPTLIIHAADDPFMDERVIPPPHHLPAAVEYELHRKGGHVGFIERRDAWRSGYYLERRIPEYLSDTLG